MADEPQQKRVKVTDSSATHRVGERRAAVKPHKRVTNDVAARQTIDTFLESPEAKGLSQTYWGETLVKNAALLRKSFGLATDDDLYLLSDPTASGKAGMLLAKSGINLADGRGGKVSLTWKDLAETAVAYQRGALLIGQNGITSRDAQALATLLKQIQAKMA